MKINRKKIVYGIIGLCVVAIIAFFVWALTPSRANTQRERDVRFDSKLIVRETSDSITMMPSASQSGPALLLYPGAHVEAAAYMAPYAELVTTYKISVVIAKPTLNLALFDTNDSENYKKAVPTAKEWYVAGHSMGGVKACNVITQHPDLYKGLILLGSYCTSSVADNRVLSISGSNDGLSTPQKIQKNKSKLPQTAAFHEIAGMDHAQFGDYGNQIGDNDASIDQKSAWKQVDAYVGAFVTRN